MTSPFTWYLKLPPKRKLLALFFVSAFLGFLATVGPSEGDVPQTPEPTSRTRVVMQDARAEIEFPVAPRRDIVQSTLPGLGTSLPEAIFTAAYAGNTYILSVIQIPDELRERAPVLIEAQLRRLVDLSSDNQLVSVTDLEDAILVEGFLIQNVSEGSYRRGVMYIRNGNLYTILMAYPNGFFPEAEYMRFQGSFRTEETF